MVMRRGIRQGITGEKKYLQYILSVTVLLTFGFSDSLTSIRMMNTQGLYSEANPIVFIIYGTLGFWGVIMFKLACAIALIGLIYALQNSIHNMYWKANAGLVSISLLGFIGTMTNLGVIAGVSENPLLILAYIMIAVFLLNIGHCLDKDQRVFG